MSWFTKLLSGGAGSLIEGIGNVADKFITTDDEKNQFKLETQKLIQLRMSEIESTARSELDAKQKILTAELQQGDNYTKRARPTVVYAGLLMIAYNYCIVPTVGTAHIELPMEFWAAWGGIVATWSIGRSAEKRGSMNRLTGLVTGSKQTSSLL